MKRCPTCQRIYTDDTLRFCLEDGGALLTESASTDQTLLLDSSQASAELPPTEILDYAVPPTVLAPDKEATLRRQKPAPTVRQQGRPTVKEFAHEVAPVGSSPKQRSTTSVVAVTVIATVLLLGIGGLGAWLILKDKNSSSNGNDPSRNGNISSNTKSSNTDPSNKNSNTTVVLTTPTPTATATPYSSPSPTPTTDTATARKEIMQALNGWAVTMNGSLDTHMGYYASTLHTYYLQTNVSAARVRAYIAPAFDKYGTRDVKLTNMQIEVDPSGTSATATFDKTFTFTGNTVYSGSGLNRFWLEKINGRWLITGEKDLKTYYINK
ncbi:MAG TPA: hypothetical protein VF779_19460 [Pyrinomonadaceae bacterium]